MSRAVLWVIALFGLTVIALINLTKPQPQTVIEESAELPSDAKMILERAGAPKAAVPETTAPDTPAQEEEEKKEEAPSTTEETTEPKTAPISPDTLSIPEGKTAPAKPEDSDSETPSFIDTPPAESPEKEIEDKIE